MIDRRATSCTAAAAGVTEGRSDAPTRRCRGGAATGDDTRLRLCQLPSICLGARSTSPRSC